jgi:cytochrome oxidase Cu insertion factor (SCO1/SenC/PrrC family)
MDGMMKRSQGRPGISAPFFRSVSHGLSWIVGAAVLALTLCRAELTHAHEWKPHYPSLPIDQDIGGSFVLTDHTGRAVTEKSFLGHYTLIYFGYTNCPDTCPVALNTIATSLDAIGPDGARVSPVFVNLDHERSSLSELGEYVSYFHPRLIGLTGTVEQLRAVAGAYIVRYRNAMNEDGDRRTVHSGMIFLIDPEGEVAAILPHDVPEDWLIATLKEHVGASRPEAAETQGTDHGI